jgi:DNA excision repair protein ERCC-2
VLADRRFQRKRNQLPRWIADEIGEGQTGLSTDAAVGMAKKFLRTIAQPLGEAARAGGEAGKGKDSWTLDELEAFQAAQATRTTEGHAGPPDAPMLDYVDSEVTATTGNLVNGHRTNGDAIDDFDDGVDDDDLVAME